MHLNKMKTLQLIKTSIKRRQKAKLKTQFEEEEDREFGADDPEGDTEAETWYEFQK